MSETAFLYRPVGTDELALIRESGFRKFPPRLPEQPIFYPVLNQDYATQIARDWNARYNADKCGYVTRFQVRTAFLERYDVQTVGASLHQEYWIKDWLFRKARRKFAKAAFTNQSQFISPHRAVQNSCLTHSHQISARFKTNAFST